MVIGSAIGFHGIDPSAPKSKIGHYVEACGTCWRREVKAKTKIRLLAMSKAMKEKRLDELNQKLGITHPDILTEYDQEEMEERQWLKKKLGYQQH